VLHGEREATLQAACGLFDAGRFLAAHELFEELWEATQGPDADFFKGLLQAAVALHHFEGGNLEGARRLHSGHRRCLSPYLPAHEGVDLARFLAEMSAYLEPALARRKGAGTEPRAPRPRLERRRPPDT
jgi:predicted metal-dependent hydrolase